MKFVVYGIRRDNELRVELGRFWHEDEAWNLYRYATQYYDMYSQIYVIDPWWAFLF